jgi:hypothetical protein
MNRSPRIVVDGTRVSDHVRAKYGRDGRPLPLAKLVG